MTLSPLRLGSFGWRAALLPGLFIALVGCDRLTGAKPADPARSTHAAGPDYDPASVPESLPDGDEYFPSSSSPQPHTPAAPPARQPGGAVATAPAATTPAATAPAPAAPAATGATQVAMAAQDGANPTGEPKIGTTFTNSIGMKFTWIPPGEFTMGSQENEPGHSDEELAHKVKLTKGYYLGVYEVTQEQYASLVASVPFYFNSRGEAKDKVKGVDLSKVAAESVSWDDAVEFIRTLNRRPEEQKFGRKYRLPTEAEWEYACRAGTTTATVYGDSLTSTQANFAGTHPYNGGEQGPFLERPTTVGSYKPNAWGLYDMHGNVWEWCYDIHLMHFYEESPPVDPTGPAKGALVVAARVIRGGGWAEEGVDLRSARRDGVAPAHRGKHYGFRVLCQINDPPKSN